METLNLFKYYAPKYKGGYNLSFYEKGEIYFQQPIKFNDPWDCKVPNIEIPRQKKFLKELLFKMTKPYGLEFSKSEWEKAKTLPRSEIKDKYRIIFEQAIEKTRKQIGVFSLSFIPDSELLWSHYASSHSGYMLHFQINLEEYYIDPVLDKTGIPIQVIYKDSRKPWNLASYFSDPDKHLFNLIRFKSNAWEYECELRFLNVKRFGFIKTPDTWLKSIIVGLASEDKLKDQLINIGNEMNLPVYFAEMDPLAYKVNIPGLGIDGKDGQNDYNRIIADNVLAMK